MRRIGNPLRQNQYIAGILPFGKAYNRQVLRNLSRHVLETVNRQIGPLVPQRLVKFLDKESLSPDLIQPFRQDPVPGGLHGQKFKLSLRAVSPQIVQDQFRLPDSQHALPAPDDQCIPVLCQSNLLPGITVVSFLQND